MTHVLTLIAPPGSGLLAEDLAEAVRSRANMTGFALGPPVWLAPGEACDLPLGNSEPDSVAMWAGMALGEFGLDAGVIAVAGRKKKLLICDMDATVVVGETLDELAALAGCGEEVAAVTARAMAGELAFEDALRERVAKLKGLDENIIASVVSGLELTPGAKTLVATMAANGAKTLLVSGGFIQFAEHVADLVGFDACQANSLEIEDGKLTGRVAEPILGRNAKLAALEKLAADNGLTPADGLAVGDGANDLDMIKAAGLGAAWRGKPVLRDAADIRVDRGDLTALLYFQGYANVNFAG